MWLIYNLLLESIANCTLPCTELHVCLITPSAFIWWLHRLFSAYPTATPGGPTTRQTVTVVIGSDVVLPCYFEVSAFGNMKACWHFTSSITGLRRIVSCTNGTDYRYTRTSVTSVDMGEYQCRVTAGRMPGLAASDLLVDLAPTIELRIAGEFFMNLRTVSVIY